MLRTVCPEALDHLSPQDPEAQRSRRDLIRIHMAMRTRTIVTRGWTAFWPRHPAWRPLKILELGAGDGTLLLGVARQLGHRWPPVHLTLLDRQALVTPTTLSAYAAQGWTANVQTSDVLDWAQSPSTALERPWDLVSTSLFLHHFEAVSLRLVLAAVAARTKRFFACEPSRSPMALAGSHMVGLIGANNVTRQDAVLSVRAGFRDHEISEHWPGIPGKWHLREAPAGPFSHVFSALQLEST